MKNILKVLVLMVALAGMLVSCETYGKPEVKHSAVAPMDGRWICYAYDAAEYAANPATATRLELVEVYSSANVNNDRDKLWLHIGYMLRNNAVSISTVSVLTNCDVSAKTFSLTDKTSVAIPVFSTPYYATTQPKNATTGLYPYLHWYSGYAQSRPTIFKAGLNVNVTGAITLNGFDTPSGHQADHIKFTLELSGNAEAADNYKYVIEGHRHTGWNEDYDETHDTATAHQKWNIGAYVEGWIFRRDGEWPIPALAASGTNSTRPGTPLNTLHTPN